MSKGGRPMIEGVVRYANNKINYNELAKHDASKDNGAPSPKIKAERDLFNAQCFQGGGHGAQCYDPLGQLFLIGKLNGIVGYRMSGAPVDLPAKQLLEDGRGYWNAREFYFREVGTKVGSHERSSRETGTRKATKLEREYLRYDRLLKGTRQYDIDCLHEIMEVRGGEFGMPVSRIIQTGLLAKSFRLPFAELSCDRDEAILEGAIRTLIALAGYSATQYDSLKAA
jgi:hypothetical protein